MSDKSYGEDPLIDDAINSVGSEGESGGSQNDNNLEDDFGFDPFKDEGDMSSEEVLDSLEGGVQSNGENVALSQNDKIDESAFDAELLGMLESADTAVDETVDSKQSEEANTVGFSNAPLPSEGIQVNEMLDAVSDVETESSDTFNADDVDFTSDQPFATEDLPDTLEGDVVSQSADDVAGDDADSDVVDAGFFDDVIDDSAIDVPLEDAGIAEVKDESTDDGDSSFFDDVLSTSGDDDLGEQSNDSISDDDDTVSNEDVDFDLPGDGFDDISSDDGVFSDDIPKDPSLDELSLTGDLDKEADDVPSQGNAGLFDNGIGMMADEPDVAEELPEPAQKEMPEEVSEKMEPDTVDEASVETKDKIDDVKKEDKPKSSFKLPWRKMAIGVVGLSLIAGVSLGALNVMSGGLPSFQGESKVETQALLDKIDALENHVKVSVDSLGKKLAANDNKQLEDQLSVMKTELDRTAEQLRQAINSIGQKSNADKEELEALNIRALELMDKFVDDTKTAQSKMAEQVYARVLSAVESKGTGSDIDPRYIKSIADTQAELKAKTESLSRRIQTQMNIINVLESENQFINKRMLSVEAENASLKERAENVAKSRSDSKVYVEVRGQDGSGVEIGRAHV